MQKQIEKGQAPKEVARVDSAVLGQPGSKPHIHFKEGGRALNNDSTWSNPGKIPTIANKIAEWILNNGWNLPQEQRRKINNVERERNK